MERGVQPVQLRRVAAPVRGARAKERVGTAGEVVGRHAVQGREAVRVHLNYLILRSQKLRNGDFFNKLGIWCECAVVGHSRQHKSFHYHATLDFRLVLRN